jgi:hypothetical protein
MMYVQNQASPGSNSLPRPSSADRDLALAHTLRPSDPNLSELHIHAPREYEWKQDSRIETPAETIKPKVMAELGMRAATVNQLIEKILGFVEKSNVDDKQSEPVVSLGNYG